MKRRDFLVASAATMLTSNIGVGFENNPKETSVIFVWLGGGISDIDFINPLPNAPTNIKSQRGVAATKNGEFLGGDFVQLAKQSKDWTVVRNYHHRDANHRSATFWSLTGEQNFQEKENNWPSFGSLISHHKGFAPKGIPTYVQMSEIAGDGPAWLGAGHVGYRADLEGITNLTPSVPPERLKRRIAMVDVVEKKKSHLPKEWPDLRNKATQMIYGGTKEALNWESARPDVIASYNARNSRFGRDCLIARRLVEAGASYVNVVNGGWDMHNNISDGFSRKAPELDTILANLVNDLKKSGLFEKTLVVVCSEFGRTYKVNSNGGRDHKPACNSLLFAGGGYEHNKFIGTTDKIGSKVEGKEFSPKDLSWTISKHFGLDKDLVLYDNVNRPRPIFQDAINILS